MDIKIEKKPWYIRYRYYMIAALAFIIFLIYVISLSLGPRKLRIETDNIQIAEVKDDKFMEYVRCGRTGATHSYHQSKYS